MYHHRFTKERLRCMGRYVEFYQDPDKPQFPDTFYMSDSDLDAITKGKFKEIIDVLYSSEDGRLVNNLNMIVSENAPESVRSFVRNVMLCDVQALQSAPDDETAFNLIVPRFMQDSADIVPYVDYIREAISAHYDDSSKDNS